LGTNKKGRKGYKSTRMKEPSGRAGEGVERGERIEGGVIRHSLEKKTMTKCPGFLFQRGFVSEGEGRGERKRGFQERSLCTDIGEVKGNMWSSCWVLVEGRGNTESTQGLW